MNTDKKRWYNKSFKPAVLKSVELGHFSMYKAKQLLAPLSHLEDKRYK